ncbi:SDR family oxidoreductase [Caviibacter abscessus]|uniref:SDR family oxidoreductase n=1 Tax=Caviibacter abscessus TaxID=1766719 RepID=UPI00082B24A9|nr:SDR family oxidoreductase [Caviibacter abscessus]
MDKRFDNKVVVVTGAGGIICSAIAKDFAEKGAKVALLDLNYDSAKMYEDEMTKEGLIAKAYKCNVLDNNSVIKVNEEIKKDFGKVDILINGAGGNSPKATTDQEIYDKNLKGSSFFELDPQGISFVFDLNILGTIIPTQIIAKDMESGSCIINISSMNSYTPLTKIVAYSGAKAAVNNFTKWIAVHLSKQGIRCNAIAPGFLVTNQNKNLLFNQDGTPTARTEKILRNTPMNRFGNTKEMLGAITFLADNEMSGFVTGVIIPVDGGFSAYSGV